MRAQFEYIRPTSLHEALEFLGHQGSRTSLIAGGTDLMIGVRNGSMTSDYVMDVSRLKELRTITRTEEALWVGAAATYTQIIANREVQENAPVLALAANQVGSRQIRNVGTLGGNVANASPAADSVPAMLVHKAWVRIQSAFEVRVEPLEDVIVGPYRTSLKPGELIVGFLLEPLPTCRSEFQRIARRKALSVARINAAVAAKFDTDGVVTDVRLSVGSITPRPCRMTAAEDHLQGRIPDETAIREAAAEVSQEMIRQSGVRSSTEYKRPAVEGLVVKTLSQVFLSHE
jgi:CO/xanthine dehydrogenase FAD-binding subunit